jgi:UDP-3-O-[3-hydroxymyristoyl] glucosamine N-acyltransferase
MAYTFDLQDINGGQELIEAVEDIQLLFKARTELNTLTVLSGANIGLGTEINELYSLEIVGDTLLHDQLLVRGFVEVSNNIVVYGTMFVGKDTSFNSNVEISNNLYVKNNIIVDKDIIVHNDISCNNKLQVQDISILNGNVTMNSMLYVDNETTLNDNLHVHKNINVDGHSTLKKTLTVLQNSYFQSSAYVLGILDVKGKTQLHSDLIVDKNTNLQGTLIVYGISQFIENVFAQKELTVDDNAYFKENAEIDINLLVHGESYLDLDVSMGSHLQVVGDVSMESSLEIDNNLNVHQKAFVDNDVSFGSHLQVVGDVSMESSLEIDNNLNVHQKAFVDNDVSFGSHLQVVGDVSMESSLEIDNNLNVHQKAFVDNDVSFGSHLQVVGDVSMESSLEIDNNLIVHQQAFVDNDVSFGSHLQVVGDVSMESSLEISDNLYVHQQAFVDNDVSFGSHLQVVGDVSMESSLEIDNNLNVHQKVFVDNDASFGSHLQVVGDVSMESSLEISDNLYVHQKAFVDNDVSFGSHLQVVGDVSMESSLEIDNNLNVHQKVFVDNDASFGSHLQVVGDVSMESSLEIDNNLNVHQKAFVDNDASFGSHLQVVGDVSMESSLEIDNNLNVHQKAFVDNDVSFGSHLQVVGDVSMESSLEIDENLNVHQKVFIDNDASFGSHLQVVGDVSMESSLEIDNNLNVHQKAFVDNDVSFGSHLQVVGDVSMESSLEISDNLNVHQKAFVDNDVSFGSHLQVVGDVSMESSLEISDNLNVHQKVFVDNDVSFGSHLQVVGDVSMESSLEIDENLNVHQKVFVDNDVSFGSHLQVVGDVSMESSLEIDENLNVHQKVFVDNDVSFGSHLQVVGDVSMESSLEISNNLNVHQKVFVDNDVSFGSHLQVVGDVSMESSLEISDYLQVNQIALFKGDVSMESNLYVTGHSNFNNSVNIDGDVSLNSKLYVLDESTFANHINANKNVNIYEDLNVTKDISFGGHLTVHDSSLFHKDVIMKDNLDLSNNLTVHGTSLFEQDITIGNITTTTNTNFYNNKINLNNTTIENTNKLYINDVDTIGVTNNTDFNIVTEKIYTTDTLYASRLRYDEIEATGISTSTFNKVFLEDYIDPSGIVSNDISGFITIDCEIYANRNSTLKNNIKIGLESEPLSSTIFTLHAKQDDVNDYGIIYDGNITLGIPGSTSSEIATNNRKLTVYGDLVIKDGGNIIIEDIENTTITQLQTEVKVTDILEIHNEGTGPALTVNQIDSLNQDIVHFQDDSANVFTIGSLGHTYIAGNLSIGIGSTEYKLQIESTDGILIPRGTTGQRPTLTSGLMRYNTTNHQFEGYSNGSWINFGGVTDVDRDTYITAEQTSDDDTLLFYTSSNERMKIDQNGNFTLNTNMLYLDNSNNNIGINTITPNNSFSVDLNGSLRIGGNPTGTNVNNQSSNGGGCLYVGTPNVNGNRGASIFLAGTKGIEQQEYYNTVIETRPYTYKDTTNGESSELLIYKGNDHKDRIRFKSGSYRFDLNAGEVEGDRVTENSCLTIDENGYIGIFTTNPRYVIDISSDNALLLPVGDNSTRPSSVTAGLIRYNTQTTQFEGYSNGAWQGLGGVIDIDQDTYIAAEENSDEDILRFYTAGNENMTIQSNGNVTIQNDLSVTGNISCSSLFLSNTKIGTPSDDTNNNLAIFAHSSYYNISDYALKQNTFGTTFINSASTGGVILLHYNSEVLRVKNDLTTLKSDLSLQNNSIVDISNITINGILTSNDELYISSNVGIGTTSPIYSIHVNKSDAILLPVGDNSSRPSSVTAGLIRYNTQTTQFEGYSNGAWQGLGGVIDIDQDTYIAAEENSDEDILRFYTAGNENMTIQSNGDVDIQNDLSVIGNISCSKTTSTKAVIGTPSGFTSVFSHINYFNDSDYALKQSSNGTTYLNTANGGLRLLYHNSEVFNIKSDTTNIYSNISLNNNSISDISDITINGDAYISNNLGVNTTSPSELVDVNGNIRVRGTLISDSDIKIKENITKIDYALESIDKLNGYKYTRKDIKDNKRHIGVIAQEVESVYPELVFYNREKDVKSVNYDGINAVLIECIKELKHKNSVLEKQNNDLEKRMSKLEDIINNLAKK